VRTPAVRPFVTVGLFAAAAVPLALAPREPVPAAAPALPIVDSAHAAATAFNWLWRLYWEVSAMGSLRAGTSELVRAPTALTGGALPLRPISSLSLDQVRRQYLHCHPDAGSSFRRLDSNIIESGVGRRAVCPSWDLSGEPPPFDERSTIDAEIRPELLPGLRSERQRVLTILDRAAAAAPADDWIAGQRVRFALDQGDTDRALAAALACRAQPGWCLALVAYVEYSRDSIVRADSEFVAALPRLPESDRCDWTDLSPLLDRDGANAYRRVPCAARDSVNARIWWLADPLYSEAGNERRAAHYARAVDVRLRSTDMPAQRWDWSDRGGGRAIREMVIRYGWPAYSYWAGHYEDDGHFGYLGIRDSATMNHGIFATAEYPVDRYHTIPVWSAIVDPGHADTSAWTLAIPDLPNTNVLDLTWWPREHIPRARGPLVQLADEQTGMFRRESSISLAVAADLGAADVGRPVGDTIGGVLIVTDAPGSIHLWSERDVVGATAVMRTSVAAGPQIIGIEFPGGLGMPSARTRFGVTPPPALGAMRPGEIGVSEPVFVRASTDNSPDGSNPGNALARMLGSTNLSGMSRVGVYWESYGVNSGDTVDVLIRVAQPPKSSPGVLHRLGARLGILGSPSAGGFTVRWREPSPGRVTTTIPGIHPIQMRDVTLDFSRLPAGPYILEVSVGRPGGVAASSSRNFTIGR